MKYNYKNLIALVFFFTCISGVTSQNLANQASPDTSDFPYYIYMMQDPDIKFNATVSAFEKYWANRTDYKGNYWKQFKRWEYINQPRVQENGKLPAPDHVMRVYQKYKDDYPSESTTGSWTQIGPVNYPANSTSQPTGLGRINCIAFHPTNGNILWAGAPSGGLWKSTDHGTNWTTLTEAMPTLGVSSILVHPTTPNTIWLGTGDRDSGDAPGMGVYKSTDGGATWAVSNSGMGNVTVSMMIMHPSNSNIIIAATSGGIFKTTNGGTSWVLKSVTNYFKDIRFKPGDPTIVYAANYGNFYRSSNTGETWTQITSGILAGTRLVIGVTPANPSIVYLIQTNQPFVGCLKSTDSGLNFTTQSTTPNIMDYACTGSGGASQASYDLCIAVESESADIIYVGGINTWKSTDGGVTWGIVSHWIGSSWGEPCAPSVHADIHSLDFSPVTGYLYSGGDGGVYYTTDGGTTWIEKTSTLAIGQVYKIGQSATNQNLVINGYQDVGTATSVGSTFTTVIGGDGMECIIDYSNSSYRYGALYYGDIRRSSGGGYSTIAKNGVNGITESGGWVTPYVLHETDPNTMFVGYKNLWRSNNVKAGSPSSVTWTQISGGNTTSCDVVEHSPVDVNILYACWQNVSGNPALVLKSTDVNSGTPTWVGAYLPFLVTDIEASPTSAHDIYTTSYAKVTKINTSGGSWVGTDMSTGLPTVGINCIVCDKNANNEALYVGTQFGVFYKNNTMSSWVQFDDQLPAVDVRELEIYYDVDSPSNNKIKAATYGRGLWYSDLYNDVPINRIVTGITLTGGDNECYDATNTVELGGYSNVFRMENGSVAVVKAGNKIILQPEVTLQPGCDFSGVIETGGQWCQYTPPGPVVEPEPTEYFELLEPLAITENNKQLFRVYPNPTTGRIVIENTGDPSYPNIIAEVYRMHGEIILIENLGGSRKYELSIRDESPGLYLLRIISNGKVETLKIVKN